MDEMINKASIIQLKKLMKIIYILILSLLYMPHLLCYMVSNNKVIIDEDIEVISQRWKIYYPRIMVLTYILKKTNTIEKFSIIE